MENTKKAHIAGLRAIKQEVEREIGADEIRRQLHNEHILSLEQEARKILSPVQEPAKPAEPVPENSIAPAAAVPPAAPAPRASCLACQVSAESM